jgi:hypothetical protein
MREKSEVTNSSLPQSQSMFSSTVSSLAYATYVVGVSALMLILNSVLCLSAHSALTLFGPEWLTKDPTVQPRASQMFYFLAPVVLMVIEWNLLDRIHRLFSTEQT